MVERRSIFFGLLTCFALAHGPLLAQSAAVGHWAFQPVAAVEPPPGAEASKKSRCSGSSRSRI